MRQVSKAQRPALRAAALFCCVELASRPRAGGKTQPDEAVAGAIGFLRERGALA